MYLGRGGRDRARSLLLRDRARRDVVEPQVRYDRRVEHEEDAEAQGDQAVARLGHRLRLGRDRLRRLREVARQALEGARLRRFLGVRRRGRGAQAALLDTARYFIGRDDAVVVDVEVGEGLLVEPAQVVRVELEEVNLMVPYTT